MTSHSNNSNNDNNNLIVSILFIDWYHKIRPNDIRPNLEKAEYFRPTKLLAENKNAQNDVRLKIKKQNDRKGQSFTDVVLWKIGSKINLWLNRPS